MIHLRFLIVAVIGALGLVALLILPLAYSAQAQTTDTLIAGLTLSGDQPGTLEIDWSPANSASSDDWAVWAKAGEEFPSLGAERDSAYPTNNSYTVTEPEDGAEDKVRVRARHLNGGLQGIGPWSEEARSVVAVQESASAQSSESVTTKTPKNKSDQEDGPRQDLVGPTVSIAGAEGVAVVGGVNQVNGAAFDVTITFSEAVGDTFDYTDITLANAQSLTSSDLITSTSGEVYTATISPAAGFSGVVTVQVQSGVAQNSSNQGNRASNVFSATVTLQSACITGGAVPASAPAELAADCATLLGLHDDLVGSATLSPAWSAQTDINSWAGITVDDNRVVAIALGNRGLNGRIPSALGGVSALETLVMNSNQFNAQIPSELSQLTSLRILELNNANLTGPILDLSVMTSLEYVDLAKNQMTGTISSLANLTELKRLHLNENQLSGSVPNIADLPLIESFNVSDNQFTGQLPATVSHLSELRQIVVTSNMLNGSIPDFSGMANLKWVQLDRNQFTGTISTLSNLPLLENFYVHRNMLSGPIPTLSNLPKLTNFWVHCNRFSGAIPSTLNNFTTLNRVLLFDNQLTGEIPDLSALENLDWLWLNHNHLEGNFTDIDAIAAKLPSSVWLTLNGNLFEGVDRDTGTIAAELPAGLSWTVTSRAPCNPRASFNDTSYSATEGSEVTVTVDLEVAAGKSVTIPIAVTHNDGATSADYSGLPPSVTFSSEEVSKPFTLSVTDDHDNDDGESLTLRFGMLPAGVNAGSPATTTLNLVDNDLTTVSFGAASYTAIEGGSVVTITVELSDELEQPLTIPITRTLQGGASAADFSGVPDSVTFNSGDTEESFTFSAAQDMDDDDDESVKLAFGTLPTGVSAGTNSEATVNITDDDLPVVSVSYEQSSYTVSEDSSVTVKVILSADPERTVTIPITRTLQGGASAADFSGVPDSVTFNSGDTEESFTFSAAQDMDDDDDESVKLAFGTLPTGVSAGANSEATVNITDDDLPVVSVSYEQSSYTVSEDSSVTVKVILSADPERTVTIPITRTLQGGASAADFSGVPDSVTFNSGDTEESFTFSAAQDMDDDDDESVKLAFGTLPTGVSAGANSEATVNITDDDLPVVSVSYEQSSYTVSEDSSVTVKVILSADPERTVTIPITRTLQGGASAADFSGVPDSVTFNSGDTEESFTFSAAQDMDDDDDESVKLAFGTLPTGVSAGTNSEATVNITDDDLPVVSVSYEQSSYTVSEDSSVTVKVILSADPERTVTIPITRTLQGGASAADFSGVPDSVTFNSGDTEESFTFSAAQDMDDDDDESVKLAFGTLPTGVSAGTNSEATVNITDDDLPVVSVSYEQSSYTVSEDSSVTVKVILSADPERTVTIPITRTLQGGASAADFSGVPDSVTFNSGDTEESFTFSAAQDMDDDDDESVKLAFGTLPTGVSAGANSEATVNITDDDLPVVSVSYEQSSYTVSEDSSVTVKVILSADPERTVTIPITRTLQGGASAADFSGVPDSVTFNSGDTEESFTFSAAQDMDDDDDESVKLAFGTLPTGVSAGANSEATVNITDDDLPVVSVSYEQSSYTVSEDSSVTVKVILSADPERTVTIPITRTLQGGASAADFSGVPDSVTFNSGDTEESFTFSAAQDMDDDDDESVKLAFGTLPTGVSAGANSEATVNITDDDLPVVSVSYEQSSYTVSEDSSVTVKVILSADPERTVTIPITRTLQGGASAADFSGVPDSVTFNSGDTEESFTFSAAQDMDDDDDESVKLAFGTLPTGVSAGANSEATVNITDDDLPVVSVSYEQSSYTVSEDSSVTVKVILSADPERTVTIPITRTLQGGASAADFSGVPDSVTFNSGDTEESFTFSAAQDMDDDDDESVKLAFGTLPTGVSAGTNSEATVNITDDDLPVVSVSYEQSSYTVSEDSSVTVKVILSADPERTVTIPITRTLQGGASAADFSGVPDSVTFNSGDTEESFTFSAAQDMDDDDDESVKLAFGTLPTGVSAGANSEATVNITDDDLPVVSVSYEQSSYTVSEDSSVTVKVILSADPERTVTIPITRTLQGGASAADFSGVPDSVTFNSGDTEESFTFSAAQDMDDDDDESVKLAFGTLPTGVSAGANSEATVNITDDDLPVVSVSYEQSSYTVSEDSSVTVKVILSADPERTVTIPITRTLQGGASAADFSGVPDSVTFNSGDTEESFTFSAAQDMDDDDDESVKLAFGTLPTGVSAGANSEATVNITDDDLPVVSVSYEQSSYTVSEDSSVTVKVILSADPERTVTIPITRTLQGGASAADFSGVPDSVTFNSGDTEESFTFSAAQDMDDDDDESVKLAFGTLPTGVSAGTNSEATVNITDDDLPVVSVSYEQSSYTVSEDSSVTVKVILSADPERTVTIPITRTLQGGASAADFSGVPDSVTFNSGDTEESFTFSAAQDMDDDDDESVKLAFGTLPTGVSAGANSEATVNITDDDLLFTSTPTATPTPTSTATPTELRPDPSSSVVPTSTSVPHTSPTSTPKPPRSASCLVPHPATPVQVCRNDKTGALQFYFVGPKEVISGPLFSSIARFASSYPKGFLPAEVEVYRGPNAGTNKEVTVHYLTNSKQLRVSTYYADNEYDTDKPYVFTIDIDGRVTHLAW